MEFCDNANERLQTDLVSIIQTIVVCCCTYLGSTLRKTKIQGHDVKVRSTGSLIVSDRYYFLEVMQASFLPQHTTITKWIDDE